ncbi:FAD-binding oxidoreductase [Legionella maioricensis]|uniref:FAD-binding oxidoreductase n=1 Tax=Legionella maioricensis TaxID=2896528 RepID=A0A9X2D1E9_9GAMM|nr:FAD-binding oxidoreductase [Legionella maioricensis]MCL9684408.1 FAD-binding oxidoreductase [Legionella maioricensis]MCL9687589.1 FAD-binding oxidoreductase [Legionella maioricensis]
MRSKKILLTNFSHALYSESVCLRPDNEKQLAEYVTNNKPVNMLARGAGLSYNDSCLNKDGLIIDTKRFNHLIHFDSNSGIAVCQGGTLFKDLFLLDPDFIPAVIPGTVYATVAGGLAHDVHGKNNPREGSFGHHVEWFELIINDKTIRCSREQHSDLFHATIAGLGLTGIITRVAIRLKKTSRFVQVENTVVDSIKTLTEQMSTNSTIHDYQVAWLDLLSPTPRALLSLANHCPPVPCKERKSHTVPKLPFSLITSWNMKLFNKFFINSKKNQEQQSLEEFNNPLDKISRWNRLYGPKGLIQFQAVFTQDHAIDTLERLIKLIQLHKATPTLAVLKLFSQSGEGLLSFCKPGFTLAIDFIHNAQAKQAITAMNQLITEINGRIYLAKDLLLNPDQYQKMYENNAKFLQILASYHCHMQSDLAKRLGIIQ